MASLNLNKISGKHNAIYEAYCKQVDPKSTSVIEAMVAAKFLKKSGLSDVVLSRIWDLSDPSGRGYLDKKGLFVALKLVSLAQAGDEINIKNIYLDTNPPKVGDLPKIIPERIQTVSTTNTDWSMKQSDKEKYEKLYESLMPVNGLIPGNKVKGVLMDSKLPLETLGKIWDLADQDKDGSLDKHEFIVAMHLVYQALDKRAIPASLPNELQRTNLSNNGFDVMTGDGGFVANFPKEMAPPPPVPPLPMAMPSALPPMPRIPPTIPRLPSMPLIETDPSPPPLQASGLDWVVTSQDKIRYDGIFMQSDMDKDGLVSGLEIKDIFLKSGVQQNCLAHIWALCDTNQSGKLTSDQFALAMWFVERKKNGIEPPDVLAPNMVPPQLRTPGTEAAAAAAVIIEQPQYSNPELEMISKEIDELARERRILENDIAQKEADIRIKNGEIRSLQSELDTLAATLKQLESQKGEAQKRLDDLKAQKVEVDTTLNILNDEIDIKRQQVNRIRDQCQKQETTIKEQETELDTKRSELQKLKDEETALEREYDDSLKELDTLTKNLQDTQLHISQVKAMIPQLEERQRQLNDALTLCKTAIEENDAGIVPDYSLKLEPDFREAKQTLNSKEEQQKIDSSYQTKQMDNTFTNANGFTSDPFKSNGFTSDPFTNTASMPMSGGFEDTFGNNNISGGFDDAFGGSGGRSYQSNKPSDPFGSSDPFGDKKVQSVTPDPSKDEFGSDPFAILHAPTSASQILSPGGSKTHPPPRPESPSPALPPKKAKQPPPRPAPPAYKGPTPTKPMPPSSGFGDSSSGMGGFADFADFDTKKVAEDIPKDFVEDPFKDYRYEDPFSIQDPFSDDQDEDPFTDKKTITSTNTLTTTANATITSLSSISKPIKNVNNFEIPTSIINDDINSSVFNKNIKNQLNNNNNNNSNNNVSNNNNNNNINNFASFDAFNNITTTTSTNNETDFTTNKNNSDFFDAFNDNFNKNTNKKPTPTTIISAFGDEKLPPVKLNPKNIATFDDDDDIVAVKDFNDEFSKVQLTSKPPPTTEMDKFSMFGGNAGKVFTLDNGNKGNNIHINNNHNKLNKNNPNNNNNNNNLKTTNKFDEDYSKTDKFDVDLEAVLQRSLVDQ